MSDFVFGRRDFLKLVGVGAAGTLAGCAQPPADRLLPYLVPPNDVLPGVSYWYASTCRECPVGCGILVKQRDGRAIKIEGNPAHPIGQGGLCARGHAGLQGLYHPDRLRTPMVKKDGVWKAIGWDEAMVLAGERLVGARTRPGSLAVLTGHHTGSLHALAGEFAAAGAGTHLVVEPFAHESLREANRRTFGVAAVPHVDFEKANLVLTFGADFLETWMSPVAHARAFAAMRSRPRSGFIAIEPRLSLTGANADEWFPVRPGSEMAVALGIARVMVEQGLAVNVTPAIREALAPWTPEAVEKASDVPVGEIVEMAVQFAAARPGLAVAGGIATQSEQSVALLAAVNLLNWVAGNVNETVRFDRTLDYDAVASFAGLQGLVRSMADGKVDVLVVEGTNPAYSTPPWAGLGAAMDKVEFRIAIVETLDETAERCDLVLPATHALETLGDATTAAGVHALTQPTMQRLPQFDARPAGDAFIAMAKAANMGAFPADWATYLKDRWKPLHARLGAGQEFEAFWNGVVRTGGVWEDVPLTRVAWKDTPVFAPPQLQGAGDMTLVLFASPSHYDGRGANRPWLQELPDPTTKVVWGSWAEIHPETAAKLGVEKGDALRVETEAGALEVPVYVYEGVRKDVVAMGLGQGHTAYTRYATGIGVNPLALLPAVHDAASGALAYLATRATVSKGSKAATLSYTQRVMDQWDRGFAQVIPVSVLTGEEPAGMDGAESGEPSHGASTSKAHLGGHGEGERHTFDPSQLKAGRHTEPMLRPEGTKIPAHSISAFESENKARGPRQIPVDAGPYGRAEHRWAMAIDTNTCTGCSACVVACNAENNIPTVGPAMIERGREMTWIRIDRFEQQVGTMDRHNDVRFVPMMCQHCSDAPCELVCPVYATYHNPEGLNAQVYNRCVGTRYCSNNCPYKVRAFNFFDYGAPEKPTFAFPEPLNWQLNPDVTVRSKGVMEKCTMCVQRILEGKGVAKDEDRKVRDGEILTACAQSCPSQAIVFGDLADPATEVAKRSHDRKRHYWALEELNTRPGVTYLKKIHREHV
jgi:anaerobic selenocysteine-containing dehydrogenase/Fe-S-cluster-containing dehydrogenase component